MTREEAINYLKSSGMTDEQIKSVIDAFTCEDCMSREAVHDLIATWLSDYLLDDTREVLEVIDEKVEDLPSVTPQTSEDCISRTALLGKIDEERKHLLALKMDGAEHILVHHARRIIEDMPTVAPRAEKDEDF